MSAVRFLSNSSALLVLVVHTCIVFADEPVSEPLPEPLAEAPAVKPHLTPMAARIAEILSTERDEVSALSDRIAASSDPREVVNLQRQIHLVKLGAEKQILQFQLNEVRSTADVRQIELLEESIASLEKQVDQMTLRFSLANPDAGTEH